jgi:hypothetical protein
MKTLLEKGLERSFEIGPNKARMLRQLYHVLPCPCCRCLLLVLRPVPAAPAGAPWTKPAAAAAAPILACLTHHLPVCLPVCLLAGLFACLPAGHCRDHEAH